MPRSHKPLKPQKGDLVLVTWVDTTGHATGELHQAGITLSATPGFYVGYSGKGRSRKLVVAPTVHLAPTWDGSAGWDAYPAGVIRTVTVLRTKAEIEALKHVEYSPA